MKKQYLNINNVEVKDQKTKNIRRKKLIKDSEFCITKTGKNKAVVSMKRDAYLYILLESTYKKAVQYDSIKKIQDEDILMRIILNNLAYDQNGFYLKWKAIKKIKHEEIFYKIAKHIETIDVFSDMDKHADLKTMSKLLNSKITKAMLEDIKSICEYAVEHIHDTEYLRDISQNAKSFDARKKARDMLMADKMKVMFVCTGNTCRSAMAEAIFREIMDDDVYVCSSGTSAESGRGPSPNTVEVCNNHGIDITKHKATYFKDSDIEDMDVVLTATQSHKEKIKIYYKNLDIYTIKEFCEEYPLDINDPYGGSLEVYDACFDEIDRVLNKIKSKMSAEDLSLEEYLDNIKK